MTPIIFRKLLATGLTGTTALLLAACGGGGNDEGNGGNVVSKPTAAIQASQTRVPVGTTVTLDGKGSTTPNGGTLSYQWDLATLPAASGTTLASPTAASTTLTPDRAGQYITTLVVNDGTANSNNASVTITATTLDPTAIITPAEQVVLINSEVTLDGSASLPPTDVDASALTYEWTLVSQPDGDGRIELQDATKAKARFIAEKTGVYTARLVVKHGDRISPAVETEIKANVSNTSPVVVIKAPEPAEYDSSGNLILRATVGQTVTLDGSASYDPDGDTLHYRWQFVASGRTGSSKPPQPFVSKADIKNSNQATAELVPDAAGTYYLDLSVYDDSVVTTKRVIVETAVAAGSPNTAPVAIILEGNNPECEFNGPFAWYQVCSIGSESGDADNDPLTSTWTYWNNQTPDQKTVVKNSYLGIPSTTEGTYIIELVVNDGKVDSLPARSTLIIKKGANIVPQTKTKIEIARVMVGDTLVFDGSDSTDGNDDPLTYQWHLVDRPDNSSAVLLNASSAEASVITDQPGLYTAQLRVSDPKGAISRISSNGIISGFAKSKNNPPSVKLTNPATGAPGQVICLECHRNTITGISMIDIGAKFSDPDNDTPFYWLFSTIKRPEGATVVNDTSGETKQNGAELFRSYPITHGDYQFQVIVSDGITSTEQNYDLQVAKLDNYPSLLIRYIDSYSGLPARQTFFPYYDSGNKFSFDSGGALKRQAHSFQLTASDQDYTITDLKTSARNGLAANFEGLKDGQIIRKGESVIFTLSRDALANEAEWVQRWAEARKKDLEVGGFDGINAVQAEFVKLMTEAEFTWSFRIKEREGYTFLTGP